MRSFIFSDTLLFFEQMPPSLAAILKAGTNMLSPFFAHANVRFFYRPTVDARGEISQRRSDCNKTSVPTLSFNEQCIKLASPPPRRFRFKSSARPDLKSTKSRNRHEQQGDSLGSRLPPRITRGIFFLRMSQTNNTLPN